MRRGVSEPRSGDELRVPRRGSFSAHPSAFTTSSRFSSNAASAAFKLDRRQQVLLEDVKSFQGIKVGRKYLDMRGVSHPTYASSFLISMSTGVENLNRVEVLWTVRHRFSAFEELRDSVWAEVFAPFPKQFSTFKRFVTLGDRDLLKRAQQLNLWMTELWLSRVMWSTAERFAVQCFLEAALPVRYSTMTVVSSGPENVGWASSSNRNNGSSRRASIQGPSSSSSSSSSSSLPPMPALPSSLPPLPPPSSPGPQSSKTFPPPPPSVPPTREQKKQYQQQQQRQRERAPTYFEVTSTFRVCKHCGELIELSDGEGSPQNHHCPILTAGVSRDQGSQQQREVRGLSITLMGGNTDQNDAQGNDPDATSPLAPKSVSPSASPDISMASSGTNSPPSSPVAAEVSYEALEWRRVALEAQSSYLDGMQQLGMLLTDRTIEESYGDAGEGRARKSVAEGLLLLKRSGDLLSTTGKQLMDLADDQLKDSTSRSNNSHACLRRCGMVLRHLLPASDFGCMAAVAPAHLNLDQWNPLQECGGETSVLTGMELSAQRDTYAHIFGEAASINGTAGCLLLPLLVLAHGNLAALESWHRRALLSDQQALSGNYFVPAIAAPLLLLLGKNDAAGALLDAAGFSWDQYGAFCRRNGTSLHPAAAAKSGVKSAAAAVLAKAETAGGESDAEAAMAFLRAFASDGMEICSLSAALALDGGLSKREDDVAENTAHCLVYFLASSPDAISINAVNDWIPSPSQLADLERRSPFLRFYGLYDLTSLGARAFLKLGRISDAQELANLATSPGQETLKKTSLCMCHCILGEIAAREQGNLAAANGHFAKALGDAKLSRLPMMEILAACHWIAHVPELIVSHAAGAVIDIASSKMRKSKQQLIKGIVLPKDSNLNLNGS